MKIVFSILLCLIGVHCIAQEIEIGNIISAERNIDSYLGESNGRHYFDGTGVEGIFAVDGNAKNTQFTKFKDFGSKKKGIPLTVCLYNNEIWAIVWKASDGVSSYHFAVLDLENETYGELSKPFAEREYTSSSGREGVGLYLSEDSSLLMAYVGEEAKENTGDFTLTYAYKSTSELNDFEVHDLVKPRNKGLYSLPMGCAGMNNNGAYIAYLCNRDAEPKLGHQRNYFFFISPKEGVFKEIKFGEAPSMAWGFNYQTYYEEGVMHITYDAYDYDTERSTVQVLKLNTSDGSVKDYVSIPKSALATAIKRDVPDLKEMRGNSLPKEENYLEQLEFRGIFTANGKTYLTASGVTEYIVQTDYSSYPEYDAQMNLVFVLNEELKVEKVLYNCKRMYSSSQEKISATLFNMDNELVLLYNDHPKNSNLSTADKFAKAKYKNSTPFFSKVGHNNIESGACFDDGLKLVFNSNQIWKINEHQLIIFGRPSGADSKRRFIVVTLN